MIITEENKIYRIGDMIVSADNRLKKLQARRATIRTLVRGCEKYDSTHNFLPLQEEVEIREGMVTIQTTA